MSTSFPDNPVLERPLGILGGMGPAATADFIAKLTKARAAERDQDHIPSITCCFPDTPDRTKAILERGPSPLPSMLRSLAILERSGVGRIVIPCNTAHYWFDDLQRETDLPLVHIVDAVKRALTLRGPLRNRVGLLATTATVRAGVYARRLAADGIDCLVPTNDEQASVMDVIHRVKSGANDKSCGEFIRSLSDRLLRRGAHAVILGCTELPLVMPTDGNELIDSTEALARECIRLSELDSLQPAFTGVSSSSTR